MDTLLSLLQLTAIQSGANDPVYSCAAELPESARFCPSCGEPVSSLSQMPTAAQPIQGGDASRLAGQARDPWVGRDVLVGDLYAFGIALLSTVQYFFEGS